MNGSKSKSHSAYWKSANNNGNGDNEDDDWESQEPNTESEGEGEKFKHFIRPLRKKKKKRVTAKAVPHRRRPNTTNYVEPLTRPPTRVNTDILTRNATLNDHRTHYISSLKANTFNGGQIMFRAHLSYMPDVFSVDNGSNGDSTYLHGLVAQDIEAWRNSVTTSNVFDDLPTSGPLPVKYPKTVTFDDTENRMNSAGRRSPRKAYIGPRIWRDSPVQSSYQAMPPPLNQHLYGYNYDPRYPAMQQPNPPLPKATTSIPYRADDVVYDDRRYARLQAYAGNDEDYLQEDPGYPPAQHLNPQFAQMETAKAYRTEDVTYSQDDSRYHPPAYA